MGTSERNPPKQSPLLFRLVRSVKQTDGVGFDGVALAVFAGHGNRTAAHGQKSNRAPHRTAIAVFPSSDELSSSYSYPVWERLNRLNWPGSLIIAAP
jgi:hypothetical protein